MSNSDLTTATIFKTELPKIPKAIDVSAQIQLHKQLRTIANFASLIIGLGGIAGLFIWFWPSQLMLRVVTLLLASFYVIWGTLAHTKLNNFAPRVFWEYVSIAGLGALMLWLVI